MSTICGNGTFCGKRLGGPSSSPCCLHLGENITSIISSTSNGVAAAAVEPVLSSLAPFAGDDAVF